MTTTFFTRTQSANNNAVCFGFTLLLLCNIFCANIVFAQNSAAQKPAAELPVKRIALFSSGVGYFEHSLSVSGSTGLTLVFDAGAVNDALKSLVINDPGQGASPWVSYPAEDTLIRTLQSLGLDLSYNPGTAEILASQRGAEIEVFAPNSISGRIVGIEMRAVASSGPFGGVAEPYLSLYTNGGIRVIALNEITSFSFKDAALNADIQRALDLITSNRISRTRSLQVQLPGSGSRIVSLSYVIAVPVWKVSYRLDIGQGKPLFQGWAIIDNNSDADWNNVELSLISGRPVSFIQELYPPYYVNRQVLPPAIAGSARAQTYAGGYDRREMPEADGMLMYDTAESTAQEQGKMSATASGGIPAPASANARSSAASVAAIEAAALGSAVGDQFAFTVKNPVTLNRRQSAMLPLVNGTMEAVKTLVLSGSRVLAAGSSGGIHPDLAAELTNTTGMKLPAGPITVFDGGTYAGDALIEFFGIQDKRLIKYGEDLSVTGMASFNAGTRLISSVTVAAGVMTVNRRQIYERTYTVKNAAPEAKRLIIEHPITGGATLTEPKSYLEKTNSLYRFALNLPANGELTFKAVEESPVAERVVLGQLRPENLVSYSTNQEIPANVRAALTRAVELRQKCDAARQAQTELEGRRTRLIADQDRVRQNLNAVGATSDLGKDYMKRMTSLDKDIDSLNSEIEKAAALVRSTQKDLDDYIAGLKL
jgi:hypothetical protein